MKRYIFPDPLTEAVCTLQPDSLAAPIVGLPDTHPANGAPCISFDVPSSTPNMNGAQLVITWPKGSGYAPYQIHGILDTVTPGGGGFECDVFKAQKGGTIRPFHLDGHFCRFSDDGTEMLINESTGFRLFARWRAGEAQADAFAHSCVDHSINMVRVSGMQDTTLYLSDPALRYRIVPDGPQYYKDLSDFYDWLSGYGLYLDFVCCMQTQTLMPDRAAQVAHLQQCFAVFQNKYAFVSKVNEQYQHDNSIDDAARLLPKPGGATFLLSNGSKGAGDESPLEPIQDLLEYHANDLNEWWRKGHNPWEMGNLNGGAGYTSESTRPDNDPSLIHFEDDGKTQTAMTLSAMIHTSEGKNADPFGPSLPWVEAHNRGVADAVAHDALHQRRGSYSRYINPDVLRDYSMGTYRWQVRF